MPWEKLSSEVFLDDYFKIRKDKVKIPNGEIITSYYHEGDHSVVVVPLLSKDEIVTIKNYRYVLNKKILEVPSGRLDPGETPEEAAKRELEEETGYKAGKLTKIGELLDWVLSTTKVSLFVATDLTPGKQKLTKYEELDVIKMNWEEIIRTVKSDIMNAQSATALMLAKQLIDRGEI